MEGQSKAINIPSRLESRTGDAGVFVGSPEPLLGSIPSPSTPRVRQGPLHGNAASSSRPGVPRSVSTPFTTSKSRNTISSTMSGVTQGILGIGPRERGRDREWTVFSQLMPSDDDTRGFSSASPRSQGGERRRNVASPSRSRTSRSPPGDRRSSILEDSIHSSRTEQLGVSWSDRSFLTSTTAPYGSVEEEDLEDLDSEDEETVRALSPLRSRWFPSVTLPTLTPLQINILKCSVAYFIGSLFTFSPYLSGFLTDLTNYGTGDKSPSPVGHIVATVTVYYNPAKTLGAMLEANLFCSMGLVFASFVSLGSMGMYWFFEVQSGWEWLADSLVLLWIGLGISTLAWTKLWMGKPTFNAACSMTSIILFIVIVREGGVDMLLEVAFIIFLGAIITNIVCYTLWPQRATRNLHDTMIKTLDSFSTVLVLITQTFLLEEPVRQPSHEKILRAVESHQASFTALKKNLMEAQSERWFGGPDRPSGEDGPYSRNSSGQAYQDAIDSLNRLGQHLNGLRGGISLQYELIKANRDGKLVLRNRRSQLSPIVEGQGGNTTEEDNDAMLQAAADMFGDIVDDLGPPLNALSTTCSAALRRLKEAFALPQRTGGRETLDPGEFRDLADTLERAAYTFESTSNHAILRLYRSGTGSAGQSRASIHSLADENQLTTRDDNEGIFLVYFFVFTLQEFSKELVALSDAISRICSIRKAEAEAPRWWAFLLHPLRYLRTRSKRGSHSGPSRSSGLQRRISAYFAPPTAARSVLFPKVRPHAPNTVQTPPREKLSFFGRMGQSMWALGARLKEPDAKYAIKTGLATAMLAAPAFFDATRPIFTEYRGEWALISFFVVIAPTIGATNFMGLHRVLGTLLGIVTAACAWSAFPENPYVLPVFGWLFSIPCFYYVVATPQYAVSARFVLLAYNLTCLYCYNLRDESVSVLEVAYHRFIAVTVGVVWAAIVSRFWWPTEARRELSKALGTFCLNVGWLYSRLVAFNSFANEDPGVSLIQEENPNSMEGTSLLARSTDPHMNESIVEFMAMELHLQIKLIELQGLLAQTQHEPRLKGPFPVALYRSILTSLQTILDKLHSMRCVTSREEWHTTVRQEFLIPVHKERKEMVGNVILYFSTLAAAFRLKSPLPPYLPPAEHSRQRLVGAIRKLDVVKNRDIKGSRQLLFFAYALTMRGVIHELDYLGHTLQEAFGVIGGSMEAFEGLFRETAQNRV